MLGARTRCCRASLPFREAWDPLFEVSAVLAFRLLPFLPMVLLVVLSHAREQRIHRGSSDIDFVPRPCDSSWLRVIPLWLGPMSLCFSLPSSSAVSSLLVPSASLGAVPHLRQSRTCTSCNAPLPFLVVSCVLFARSQPDAATRPLSLLTC